MYLEGLPRRNLRQRAGRLVRQRDNDAPSVEEMRPIDHLEVRVLLNSRLLHSKLGVLLQESAEEALGVLVDGSILGEDEFIVQHSEVHVALQSEGRGRRSVQSTQSDSGRGAYVIRRPEGRHADEHLK